MRAHDGAFGDQVLYFVNTVACGAAASRPAALLLVQIFVATLTTKAVAVTDDLSKDVALLIASKIKFARSGGVRGAARLTIRICRGAA